MKTEPVHLETPGVECLQHVINEIFGSFEVLGLNAARPIQDDSDFGPQVYERAWKIGGKELVCSLHP